MSVSYCTCQLLCYLLSVSLSNGLGTTSYILVMKIILVLVSVSFYQRVSIASYASAGVARGRMSLCASVCLSVRLSVRTSVTLRYCIKTKKASVMIFSPSESLNILVSRNIWFITKFDRGHPERERFLRLGCVRTGDFGDFRPINRCISETV